MPPSAPAFESLNVEDRAKEMNDRVLVLDDDDNGLAELVPDGTYEQTSIGDAPETDPTVLERVHEFIVDTIGRA